MANTNVNLIGLDFNAFKANLKNWFKNNTQFKDIDFDGSNISQLIELMAYNDYLNAFYVNMIGAEMFLDSAQLRDSVVSRAKELNYTPRSFRSAKATLKLDIIPSFSVTTVVVAIGTTFTSKVGSNTFTFSTEDSVVVTSANGVVYSANVTVYEGAPVNESFTVNYANTQQRFILSNPTVDTQTIDITVYEDGGSTPLTYTAKSDLFGVINTSQVFWVQAAENQQYELIFGDGVFGRRPKDGSTMVVNYLASSGELPNGASLFTNDGAIDGHTNIVITTLANASGGALNESIESVRFNAPRASQTQGRAITESDYETLLKLQFPEIQAISVYGGESNIPPVYGKVFVSVDIFGANGAPQVNKDRYAAYLQTRKPTAITPVFIDPDFMDVEVSTRVSFNTNTTSKLTSDIQSLVHAVISQYNLDNLEDFKSTLRGSQLVKNIDAADASILSNDTQFEIVKKLTPTTGTLVNFIIDFQQPLNLLNEFSVSTTEAKYGAIIHSSPFSYNGNRSLFLDDGVGNIWIGSFSGSKITPILKIGTVDYSVGVVTTSNFIIDSYEGAAIAVSAVPASRDIICKRNTILSISDDDIHVTVVGVAV